MSPSASLEAYFAEARSWDADRKAQSQGLVRLALWIAGAGWLGLVMACGALLLLMPLKRVEPFVIRVDNTTGILDVVPVYAGKSDLPDTVTRYLLTHYITVCERFDFATAESDYEECGAFHTAARNQAWYAAWSPNNPISPLNLYRDGSSIRSEVNAVSFFKRGNGVTDLAQVRYIKTRRGVGGEAQQVTHWIANIQYAYAEPSSDPKVRRWNPLGFKVVEFKVEPEIVPEATGTPAGAATTAAGLAQKASATGGTP
jgi:type IV secretion system protein VirB8